MDLLAQIKLIDEQVDTLGLDAKNGPSVTSLRISSFTSTGLRRSSGGSEGR
jgi:hypothetical protein